MDARLILNALHLLRSDFTYVLERQKLLKNLVSTASAAAASPSDAAIMSAFSTAAEETVNAWGSASANTAALSLRKAIDRLGLSHLVGESIQKRLKQILSRNPFLLPQASQDIATLCKEVENDLDGKVTAGIGLLEQLGIKPVQADSSLADVGILLPTSLVNDDLIEINKNLKRWERVVRNFAELTAGKPPSAIKLAAVSSGSFEVSLSLDLAGAMAIALVVKTLVGGFTALTRARQHRAEMEAENYPTKAIEGAKEHEESLLEMTVHEAADAALQHGEPNIEEKRLHELKNLIKDDVDFIARSINVGVDVEVLPPPLPEQEQPELTAAMTELQELGQKINTLTRNLPDRSAPLAELPAPVVEEETEQKPPPRRPRASKKRASGQAGGAH